MLKPEGNPLAATESQEIGSFQAVRDLVHSRPMDVLGALGEKLFLIGADVQLFKDPHARADLLAVDPQGTAVVVAVQQQGENSLLDRGLMCAGLVAGWKPDFFFLYGSGGHAAELSRFLEVPPGELNRKQRVILVAPSHGFTVYSAARWLEEHYAIEIRCLSGRIDPSSSGLSLSQVELPTRQVGAPAVEEAEPVFPRISDGPLETSLGPLIDAPVEPAFLVMGGSETASPKVLWPRDPSKAVAELVERRFGQILQESSSQPTVVQPVAAKTAAEQVAIEEQVGAELVAAVQPAAPASASSQIFRVAAVLLCAGVALAAGLLITASRQARAVSQSPPKPAQPLAPPPVVVRAVRDAVSGKPIPGAQLYYAGKSSTAGDSGEFQLERAEGQQRLLVKAPGYRQAESSVDSDEPILLEPIAVRGYYLNHGHIANPLRRESILNLIRSTSANTIVLGVKDASGHLNVAVDHPLARQIRSAANDADVDLAAQVAAWKADGIYTIALVALFKDGLLARARPELALQSIKSRRVITENDSIPWTDPSAAPVRDYNIAVATAAAAAGFDEIQFDFVRYPTAELSYEGADRQEYERRLETLSGFLRDASKALAPHNVYLSANVFGVVCTAPRVSVIGQKIEEFAKYVDYISPMLYPSYFQPGRRYPVPLQYSYQLVQESLEKAGQRLKGANANLRLRPWLQNFPDRGSPNEPLTADNIRSQVKAAEDARASGWMLWDARNRYDNTTAAMRLLERERSSAEAAKPDSVSGGSLLPVGGGSNFWPPALATRFAGRFGLMMVLLLAGCCLVVLYGVMRVAWVVCKWSNGEKPPRWQPTQPQVSSPAWLTEPPM